MTGPYVLFAKVIGASFLLLGVMWFGMQLQKRLDAGHYAELESQRKSAVIAEQEKAARDARAAAATAERERNVYEQRLKKQAGDLVDATDNARRLRDALTIYANSTNLSHAPGVPVCDDKRISTLSIAVGDMADFCTQAATVADSCQAKLMACEGWVRVVKEEMNYGSR